MTNMINWDKDADGIVTLILDDPNQRANTMNQLYQDSMGETVARLVAEKDSITGVIITSAKDTFFAGGDLNRLISVTDETAEEFFTGLEEIKKQLRTLETLGKPVVAALNGAALGGGLEIALACHHRIALDNPKAQFGLPEVSLGLLPGGGGVTRVTRMLGVQDALMKVLLQGQRMKAAQAKETGLIDEIVATPQELISSAKAWIKANPESVQRFDVKGYKIPGGTPSNPKFAAMLPVFPGNLRKQIKGAPMPAPHHIMAASVEGTQVDIDTALRIESRYLTDLVRGQVAKNMIQAFWFDLNSINGGGSRPAGQPKRLAQKVAVLGAGMMGAGIAYVSARNGIEVVLRDMTIEAAERGKDYSRKILDKAVSRGKLTEEKKEEVLGRIHATADVADLAGCDFVIEAVFENTELKHKVFAEIEPIVNADSLLGSNTSTLPITGLAEGVKRAEDFIGIHFFSPVDKMPLVEIIRGEKTSDSAVARVLDYVAQIKKTPIVVNDSRGFFTSRVIGTFVNEALNMLAEGVHPITIEQAATQAGYPVGPLQLLDELNLETVAKIAKETRGALAAAGTPIPAQPGDEVVAKMLELGRAGKLRGAGFFDYDENGKRTGLWSGLAQQFPVTIDPATIDLTELQERFLFVESIDSARCLEENVLITSADANIGSIFGIGFPPWTGGVLQYSNGYEGGLKGFVARADQLAERYGERFTPGPLLRKKADNGEKF